jgi:hypothetical protein
MRHVSRNDDALLCGVLAGLCKRPLSVRDDERWLTMRSPLTRSPITMAIVHVRRERLLVVLDGEALRAPTAADWEALAHGEVTASQPGGIAALRRALAAWRLDRDMSAMVARPGDHRLRSRREADEALLQGTRVQRVIGASAVTQYRRVAMSRPRDDSTQRANAIGAPRTGDRNVRQSSVEPLTQRHASAGTARAVRIVCGVLLRPTDD